MENTDPRFQQSRFQSAEKPRRYSAEGRSGDDASRKAAFEEGEQRQ
jgi:hypothetical protein